MTGAQHSLICLLLTIISVGAQFEGDRCRLKNTRERGRCTSFENCEYAHYLLKVKQRPQHCGFNGSIPIVCCPRAAAQKPVAVGQKSEKQCGLYYPTPVIPSEILIPVVFGGEKSQSREFPHMALLGYGGKSDIQWLCGGSLISEQFVLTAAHCINSQFGQVRWVRLGDLDIQNATDDATPEDFEVATVLGHPEYKSNSHYHDIALIKLDRVVKFDDYVKPACLYTNWTVEEQLIATGWGKLDFFGDSSSHLMKVDLNYISYQDCARRYSEPERRLRNGIVDKMQICAGSPDGKDTCPGDSGGPLQIKQFFPTRYYVVGVTSFGKACGVGSSAGVYTRVAQYVDWIEEIVWP